MCFSEPRSPKPSVHLSLLPFAFRCVPMAETPTQQNYQEFIAQIGRLDCSFNAHIALAEAEILSMGEHSEERSRESGIKDALKSIPTRSLTRAVGTGCPTVCSVACVWKAATFSMRSRKQQKPKSQLCTFRQVWLTDVEAT